MPGCLEHAQRFAAACALQPPTPVAQIEDITDVIGELPQARDALRCRTIDHIVKSGKIGPQAASDLILSLHAAHGSAVAS